jgi:hypothetical protein
MGDIQGAPIERPSDLMMPGEGNPAGVPTMTPASNQGGGPGGMEALKRGVQFLLRFMAPEELLEALLKLARTQDLPVDEAQLQQLVNSAQAGGELPAGGPPQGGLPRGGPPMGGGQLPQM